VELPWLGICLKHQKNKPLYPSRQQPQITDYQPFNKIASNFEFLMNLAVIPARGGSQRIPKKNIRRFCGKPMIGYAIEAALGSSSIEQVIVSTDSKEISDIARSFGAQVPFLRPAELSDEHATTSAVIVHAIKAMRATGSAPENVCCIFPCTPFLTADCLDDFYAKMEKARHSFVYPVVLYSHPIQRAMTMDENGKMSLLQPKFEYTRTQDLQPTYHDAAQFYWGRVDAWLSGKKMLTEGIGIRISSRQAIDIDNFEDLEKAEWIMKSLKLENSRA